MLWFFRQFLKSQNLSKILFIKGESLSLDSHLSLFTK